METGACCPVGRVTEGFIEEETVVLLLKGESEGVLEAGTRIGSWGGSGNQTWKQVGLALRALCAPPGWVPGGC